MELHKAIQQIIKAHGKNTLQEPRLLSLLNDYLAYKSTPACKFVISSLFNEWVIALLMNYGQWNTQCEQLVNQVSKTTGSQVGLVSLVLKSFAFGLGRLKDLYSHQNRILASNESYVERSKNDFQVVDSSYFNMNRFMYVGNVSRIVIYWDKN